MAERKPLAGACLTLSAALLVGCSAGNLALGLTHEQMTATWEAAADVGITLTLNEDGTLEATNWPENLHCVSNDASTVSDLQEAERPAVTGTWDQGGEDLGYKITLWLDDDVCPVGGTTAYMWRTGEDLSMCIQLPVGIPNDTLERNQVLVLGRRTDESESSLSGCF